MAEPAAAKPVSPLCVAEGITCQQREDRRVDAGCACTAGCPSCHGQGRLYARGDRGSQILHEVLSVRYNADRPTLLATNYPRPGTVGWEFRADGQSAENLEQRVGPRIYSRLHEMCDLIDVLGPDQREVQHDARQARDGATDGPARGTRPARS